MKDISMQTMAYFLTAAECCNFSQAAEKLYVSQPHMSKCIRGLEADLGIPLFGRTSHGVVLTREGRYLYDEWKPLYRALRKSLTEIENMAAKSRSTLTIGCSPALGSSPHLSASLDRFEESHPDTDVSVEVCEFNDLRSRLLNGQLDMIFTYNFNLDGMPDLSATYLYRSEVCIALPRTHALAGREHIDLSQLCGETLLLEQYRGTEPENNWVLAECQKNGCFPGHIRYTANIASLTAAIGRGKGFSLICRDIADYFDANMATYPLPQGYIPVYVVLAWLENRETPEMEAFSRIVNTHS